MFMILFHFFLVDLLPSPASSARRQKGSSWSRSGLFCVSFCCDYWSLALASRLTSGNQAALHVSRFIFFHVIYTNYVYNFFHVIYTANMGLPLCISHVFFLSVIKRSKLNQNLVTLIEKYF